MLSIRLLEKNQDIPTGYESLRDYLQQNYSLPIVDIGEKKCEHPRDKRKYIGNNLLKCGVCGKEFN